MAGHPEARVGISRLHHPVLALGPGRRIGIWFQGCSIRCRGCMARDTWEPAEPADRVALDAVTAWVDGLPHDQIDGVTISGGEPFDQPEALGALTRRLRAILGSGVDILVYTGYGHDLVANRYADVLTAIDVLVTEPYRLQAGSPRRWRGSANQRMVALTDLGRRRYAEHVGAPADTGLQVDVRRGELRLIGVPRPGDLARVEQGLAARGVAVEGCSWTS